MSEAESTETGAIGWIDLTVENAEEIRDFYRAVVGWKPEPVSMGEYDDFNMTAPESGRPMAGVCHARGGNADLPPVWIVYFTVKNVEESAARCREMGGKILSGPKGGDEHGRYCVVADPEGAVCALFQPPGA